MNDHSNNRQENKSQHLKDRNFSPRSLAQSLASFESPEPETNELSELQVTAKNSARLKQLQVIQTMADNSPQVKRLLATQRMADNRPAAKETLQFQSETKNNTGLPNRLKSGIENLSGYAMDDVKVHYNSNKPAQLNAHAYAQGTDIHLASGQEKHLPHEAWHVVQQKQNRVRATTMLKGKEKINDDAGLEREADVMGKKALQSSQQSPQTEIKKKPSTLNNSKGVPQLFTAPPAAPPAAGVRDKTLNADGVPTESHVTTVHGAPNDLNGTTPGAMIKGWLYILSVGAGGPWVRFHLVNENVGGLGDQNNLVPTSHATNHAANWKSFETRCKNYANAQTGIHVTVDVVYQAPIPGALADTLDANTHFYPSLISAQVHYWDPVANVYKLDANQPKIVPFPLLPPADANKTNLKNQSKGWIKNTLMANLINDRQAAIFFSGLNETGEGYGYSVQDYIDISQEETDESKLLDALDTFATVELIIQGRGRVRKGKKRGREQEIKGARVPPSSRIHILNGAYHV